MLSKTSTPSWTFLRTRSISPWSFRLAPIDYDSHFSAQCQTSGDPIVSNQLLFDSGFRVCLCTRLLAQRTRRFYHDNSLCRFILFFFFWIGSKGYCFGKKSLVDQTITRFICLFFNFYIFYLVYKYCSTTKSMYLMIPTSLLVQDSNFQNLILDKEECQKQNL